MHLLHNLIRGYHIGELMATSQSEIEKMLIEEYGYSPKDIVRDFEISKGKGQVSVRLPIVVFHDNKGTRSIRIAILMSVDEGHFDENELKDLARCDIPFLCWYDGGSFNCYALDNRHPSKIKRIPHIPRPGESIRHFGNYSKKDLQPAHNLKSIFKRIHNVLYGSSNMRMASKLSDELIKLLFCKIFDELSEEATCLFGISQEEMENSEGRIRCAKRINGIFDAVKEQYPDIFKQDDTLRLDSDSIAYVVGELEPFSILKTNLDAIGSAFEVFIGSHIKGEKGEFFTPRPVVRAAVEIILSREAQDKNLASKRFLDPAMGTGGFIIIYLEQIRNLLSKRDKKKSRDNEKLFGLAEENVTGIDIEEEQVRLAKAFLTIMRNGRASLFRADSLLMPSSWARDLSEKVPFDSQDFILTNPPFGTKIPVIDKELLRNYELAGKWNNASKASTLDSFSDLEKKSFKANQHWRPSTLGEVREQVPDILFLERCIKLLRKPKGMQPGGTMGIVLPRQILSGNETQYVRQWLFNNAKIIAVIDLPAETFQPHTGTKTSLLFLERGTPTQDYDIFMGVCRSIGHDRRGNAVFVRDDNGDPLFNDEGENILANDLIEIVDAFHKFIKGKKFESGKVFSVQFSKVQFTTKNPWGRIDASFYQSNTETIDSYKLPRNWKIARLGEIARVSYPGRFKRTYVKAEDGIPFLSGNDTTQAEPSNVKYISKSTPKVEDYMLQEGWILITRSGTVGISSFVGSRFAGCAGSEHLLRVVPDTDKVDPGYLYAFLSSSIGVATIKKGIYGSVVDEITPDYVESLMIPLPPIERQRELGKLVTGAEKMRYDALKQIDCARKSILKDFDLEQ